MSVTWLFNLSLSDQSVRSLNLSIGFELAISMTVFRLFTGPVLPPHTTPELSSAEAYFDAIFSVFRDFLGVYLEGCKFEQLHFVSFLRDLLFYQRIGR